VPSIVFSLPPACTRAKTRCHCRSGRQKNRCDESLQREFHLYYLAAFTVFCFFAALFFLCALTPSLPLLFPFSSVYSTWLPSTNTHTHTSSSAVGGHRSGLFCCLFLLLLQSWSSGTNRKREKKGDENKAGLCASASVYCFFFFHCRSKTTQVPLQHSLPLLSHRRAAPKRWR
jgi:hypothetical protein